MSSIETIERVFDNAKNATLRNAEEIIRLEAVIETQNQIIGSHENTIESYKRLAKSDAKRIQELEEANRSLERANAVQHSRNDLIISIIKNDGELVAGTSDLAPEQIQRPRPMRDDKRDPEHMAELYKKLEAILPKEEPPHPALKDAPYGQVMEDIAASVEREKA